MLKANGPLIAAHQRLQSKKKKKHCHCYIYFTFLAYVFLSADNSHTAKLPALIPV